VRAQRDAGVDEPSATPRHFLVRRDADDDGVKFYKSGIANGLLVPFGFLKADVPQPFRAEWNGGMGQVIHHKFVVIDCNGASPLVYCGSVPMLR
jgi:hypothetical protein